MRFYPAPYNRAGVEDWIDRSLRRYAEHGHGLWAMVLKVSGEMIGDCGLTVQNVNGSDEIEIGYHVRRDLWGQGLATEAARACRDFGFGCPRSRSFLSFGQRIFPRAGLRKRMA